MIAMDSSVEAADGLSTQGIRVAIVVLVRPASYNRRSSRTRGTASSSYVR